MTSAALKRWPLARPWPVLLAILAVLGLTSPVQALPDREPGPPSSSVYLFSSLSKYKTLHSLDHQERGSRVPETRVRGSAATSGHASGHGRRLKEELIRVSTLLYDGLVSAGLVVANNPINLRDPTGLHHGVEIYGEPWAIPTFAERAQGNDAYIFHPGQDNQLILTGHQYQQHIRWGPALDAAMRGDPRAVDWAMRAATADWAAHTMQHAPEIAMSVALGLMANIAARAPSSCRPRMAPGAMTEAEAAKLASEPFSGWTRTPEGVITPPEGQALRIVNSNMGHAVDQAMLRAGFTNAAEARQALQAFGSRMEAAGGTLPGAVRDTARPDRIIVPGLGNNGGVVYQLVPNGTLRLKTVLIFKP